MCLGVDCLLKVKKKTPFEERLLKMFYLKTILHIKVACKNLNKMSVCLTV